MLVHVITPRGGRFEFPYPDNTPAEKILAELAGIRRHFGFNGTIRRKGDEGDPFAVDFGDPASGFVWDHADTRVVILKTAKTAGVDVAELDKEGKPIEANQIKGPAAKPDIPF